MKHKKELPLPENYTLSVSKYLRNIGQSFQEKNSTTGYNRTLSLFEILNRVHIRLFELLDVENNDISRTQSKTVIENALEFPTEIHKVLYRNKRMEYSLILERMINGHMGYYEDDIKATVTIGDKTCDLSCYIFLRNKLSIEAENFTDFEFEKTCELIALEIENATE